MPGFGFKTKGNGTPKGKPRVYFTSYPDDFNKYFNSISEDILSKQNCAIYYALENSFEDENYRFDISQMQLFVVPITEKLLKNRCRTMNIDIPLARMHHIPILPLMQEGGLMEAFNEAFGNLQYLDKNDPDPTAISYDKKLEKFLDSVLVGDELIDQVRDAFDAYIFLSYRKKDRMYAQKLMKLIHQNPRCRDIAIWYDEFLVPGENFNNAIEKMLIKSDLFALAVTPNLVNEKNYIMSVEYPKAVEHNKRILPVELVPTKYRKLKRKYKKIPEPVESKSVDKMHNMLLSQLDRLALSVSDDPKHTFFIALAYLNGIDVEVDSKRAASLMEQSANGGCLAAVEKLVGMYNYGKGVIVDYIEAIEWQKKLCEGLEKEYRDLPDKEKAHRLIDAYYHLGIFARDQAQTDDMEHAFMRMKELAGEFCSDYPDDNKFARYQAESVVLLGDVSRQKGNKSEAEKYYREGLTELEKLSHTSGDDLRFEISLCCGRLGELATLREDYSHAEEYFGKMLEYRKELVNQDDVLSRERLGLAYQRMGVVAFQQGKYDEAEAYFLEANNIHSACAEETEIGAIYGEVSYNLYYFGKIKNAKGEYDTAVNNLKKAVYIADSLSKQFHQLPKYSMYQCIYYAELGKSYAKLGEFNLADACYEMSSDIGLAYSARMDGSVSGDMGLVVGALIEYREYQKFREEQE